MNILLGLTGLKGSGKDTFAEALVVNHDYVRYAFADPLKVSAAAALGCTVEALDSMKNNPDAVIQFRDNSSNRYGGQVYASVTVREYLQRYGTEAHREVFGDDFWVTPVVRNARLEQRAVITDARFMNEQQAIIDAGGFILRIDRGDDWSSNDAHASENIEHGLTDLVIPNNGTIADLAMTARNVVREIKLGRLTRAS